MNPQSGTAVLLITCKDQKGLVAAVAEFVYRNNGNVIHADQHTDKMTNTFLQRVEWELNGFKLSRQEAVEAFAPIAQRFGMAWELRYSDEAARVGIMVSFEEYRE
ncbi:MAG: ACT domain-containing protein [Dehalococcoidia bacterium]|nr:ACT domain-containing protein [Dehalococcoidia bacterium]